MGWFFAPLRILYSEFVRFINYENVLSDGLLYPKALSKYDKSGAIGESAADRSRVMPFALSFGSLIPGRA